VHRSPGSKLDRNSWSPQIDIPVAEFMANNDKN
jgi:hypothetical protein